MNKQAAPHPEFECNWLLWGNLHFCQFKCPKWIKDFRKQMRVKVASSNWFSTYAPTEKKKNSYGPTAIAWFLHSFKTKISTDSSLKRKRSSRNQSTSEWNSSTDLSTCSRKRKQRKLRKVQHGNLTQLAAENKTNSRKEKSNSSNNLLIQIVEIWCN